MSRGSIPPLDPTDLRDHADAERIERIWERLSDSLAYPAAEARFMRPARSQRRGLWLAAAASLVLVFGGGVLVGQSLSPKSPLSAAVRPTAEHAQPSTAPAGEPKEEPLSGQPLAARSTAATPNHDEPAGPGRVREGAHPPAALAAPPAHSARVRAERPGDPAVEPPSAGPQWLTRYNSGNYGDARELLAREVGGIRGAIAAAHDAFELTALAEIAWSGGDQPSAVAALTRVATDFQGGQYAQIAAYKLGKFYESQGQSALAGSYAALARSLSANGNLDEDALCIQVRSAKQRPEALQMAEDYLAKYPHGRCKEDAERIVANEPDDETSEPPSEAPSAGARETQSDASPPDAGLSP
jgi:hypothetical protein